MGTVQEVRIAKRTGFCYGVREAIDKAKEASAAGKATHTLGQVVHNEGVVRDLQDLGIQTVEIARRRRSRRGGRHPRPRRPARRHAAGRGARPRGHRRHLHVGDPGAARAGQARRGRLHDRPARHAEAPRGRRPARLRARRDRRRRGRGVGGGHPAPQADGAHQPVDPAALEVRAARRVHGLARPRAQDRQHGLPGHDPPPAGHARGGRRGRPDGRRRRPLEREHQGTDPAVRDRRDGRDPDRERPRPDRPGAVRRRPDRRRHRRDLDADRGPARRDRAHPRDGRHARGAAQAPPSSRTPPSTAPPRPPAARRRFRHPPRTADQVAASGAA